MNTTRLTVTVVAAITLTACAAPGPATTPPATLPPDTHIVVQQLPAGCASALAPLRAYMAARTTQLDDAAKDVIQTLATPAYDQCTPTDWRTFEDNELLPWARGLPAAPGR